MNHMYHVSGLTDYAAQKAQAEKRALKGETSWVHAHSRIEECNDNCELIEPAKKEI